MDSTLCLPATRKISTNGMVEAENLLLSKKLQALKDGYLTDCTFLVGANSMQSKKFAGVKRDFVVASPHLETVLSMKDEATTIKNIPPNIFELILEFVHIGKITHRITIVSDALALMKGAKFLKIEAITLYCNHLIMNMVSVDTVWEIMNAASKLALDKCIVEVCSKLLSTNLQACINHPTFLSATQESVVALLKIDSFVANADEFFLLKACLNWTSNLAPYTRRSKFRNLLPHLRILTLDGEACAMISEYISEVEQCALFTYFGNPNEVGKPSFVSPNTTSRFLTHTDSACIQIIPENLANIQETLEFNSTITNTFRFIASVDLFLTGIDLMGRLQSEPKTFAPKFALGKTDRPKLRRHMPIDDEVYNEHVSIVITNSECEDISEELKIAAKFNTSTKVPFSSHFFVPKDSITVVTVELINPQGSYRNIKAPAVLDHLMRLETVVRMHDLVVKNLNDEFEYEDPPLYFIHSLMLIPA